MVHGIVFVAYCVTTVLVAVDQRWTLRRTALGLVGRRCRRSARCGSTGTPSRAACCPRAGGSARPSRPASIERVAAWVLRNPVGGALAGLGHGGGTDRGGAGGRPPGRLRAVSRSPQHRPGPRRGENDDLLVIGAVAIAASPGAGPPARRGRPPGGRRPRVAVQGAEQAARGPRPCRWCSPAGPPGSAPAVPGARPAGPCAAPRGRRRRARRPPGSCGRRCPARSPRRPRRQVVVGGSRSAATTSAAAARTSSSNGDRRSRRHDLADHPGAVGRVRAGPRPTCLRSGSPPGRRRHRRPAGRRR